MIDMSDMMTFPKTVEEFMENYKVVDTEGIYMSKGAELVPIFRMRQWFEHLPSADVVPVVRCKDCAYRNGDYCNNYDGFAHFDHYFVQLDDYCSRGERMDAEADYEWSEEEQAYIEQGYIDTQVGLPDLYMN